MIFEFSGQVFEKKSLNIKFYQIRPVRAGCSMLIGRQTDRLTHMTKLIVSFRNFANAPKNCLKKICGDK